MRYELWRDRLTWIVVAGAILVAGKYAHAQGADADGDKALIATPDAKPAAASRPWLGLHCFPADAPLRAQVKLPEGEGLVVGAVAPDSPAAAGGIQPNDILLKVDDRPLKEVADLIETVAGSADKKLSIALLRAGEEKTVEVTPKLIPVDQRPAPADAPSDRTIISRWLDRVPGLVDGLPQRARLLRPGMPVLAPFPKDLHLTVTKDGDAPAKVIVTKGDEKWETTEDKLTDLPESVRGHVEMFLGKFPTAFPAGGPLDLLAPDSAATPVAPNGPVESARARELEGRIRRQVDEARRRAEGAQRRLRNEAGPAAERVGEHVEDRFEALERRMLERLEALNRLIEERTKALPPAQPTPAPKTESAGPTLPVPEET